jgi:ferredoxin--NADP+ reductase
VIVDGQSKFACVDGPEFDAHLVDFKNLTDRNKMYRAHENKSLKKFEHDCQLDNKIAEAAQV